MDEAIEELDGTHFDLAERVRRVESRIAPPGSAAAPYYTRRRWTSPAPAAPGCRRWAETRFPVYDLVSTWYHEGVPGHHLQLAQWVVRRRPALPLPGRRVGMVSANAEGWALYAERLMDELGFLTDPERRLGYLDAQMMRAARVIVDIGMHLELEIPADSPFHPGERWTPELAQEFFGAHSGRPADFVESELIRYLGMPGQAIGYKLGERAWLPGRENARARRTATPSTPRRGTWRRCRRARWAWTTWWRSCPRCDVTRPQSSISTSAGARRSRIGRGDVPVH